MSIVSEKGGGSFHGIKLLLCENPLPPIDEAIAAAQAEAVHSNYYTEPYSAPLRQIISEQLGVAERLIHINAGSELIRQRGGTDSTAVIRAGSADPFTQRAAIDLK
jgi:histidinol-phosphate aminotransferase